MLMMFCISVDTKGDCLPRMDFCLKQNPISRWTMGDLVREGCERGDTFPHPAIWLGIAER